MMKNKQTYYVEVDKRDNERWKQQVQDRGLTSYRYLGLIVDNSYTLCTYEIDLNIMQDRVFLSDISHTCTKIISHKKTA